MDSDLIALIGGIISSILSYFAGKKVAKKTPKVK
jgi:hypothetical protein